MVNGFIEGFGGELVVELKNVDDEQGKSGWGYQYKSRENGSQRVTNPRRETSFRGFFMCRRVKGLRDILQRRKA
jgi:hypothetical protein